VARDAEETPRLIRALNLNIENHQLINTPDDGVELEFRYGVPSRYAFAPRIAVVHYGVTDSLDALWRAQNYRKFFAHVSIDGWSAHTESGPLRGVSKVIQQLDFDQRGTHCGSSSYKGSPHCNAFAFGIEIANPGPLKQQTNGSLRTVYEKPWPISDAIEAEHKSGSAPRDWSHWAQYSDEEIDLVIQLVGLWRMHYGITDVVGHDDISPGRKSDPGPAFPIEFVRKAVFGAMQSES